MHFTYLNLSPQIGSETVVIQELFIIFIIGILTSFRHVFNPKWMLVYQGTQRLFSVKYSVRRSSCCLEFSFTWGRLKVFIWPCYSCTIFEAYLINFLLFLKFNFSHFTAQVRLFFVQKWIPKTFRFKNVWRGIRKILTFVISSIASKIFGKIILKPL